LVPERRAASLLVDLTVLERERDAICWPLRTRQNTLNKAEQQRTAGLILQICRVYYKRDNAINKRVSDMRLPMIYVWKSWLKCEEKYMCVRFGVSSNPCPSREKWLNKAFSSKKLN
jgi:hypothetical protein